MIDYAGRQRTTHSRQLGEGDKFGCNDFSLNSLKCNDRYKITMQMCIRLQDLNHCHQPGDCNNMINLKFDRAERWVLRLAANAI